MLKKKLLIALAAGLVLIGTMDALGQAKKDTKAMEDKSNISAPGPTGGSCSATSDDQKKTCSINCKSGTSANCSNTKTTVSCKCSP